MTTFPGIRRQLSLDLNPELIVDNFAGGGGASTGIELALGRHVDIAVNHDRDAVALHAMNHPQTQHLCEDVFAVDPVLVTARRPVGLAWFSPDCKHFSKAKGGKPRAKKIRGLAWVMVKWAATVRPRVMILENVEEFRTWGPLLPDGQPCPLRKGRTFANFVARLRNLGYAVESRELRACDYGAPALRKRLFLIARCDGRPIVWPQATHGDPRNPETKRRGLKAWRTAAECIDWSIPCPSIFLTPEEAKPLGIRRPLAEATMRRIARGVFRYVLDTPTPFIVGLAHGEHKRGAGSRSHGMDEPIRTVHAQGNNHALVSPHLTKFRAGSVGSGAHEPFHTVTAGGEQARPGTGNAMGLASATLVQTGYGERPGQAPRAPGLNKPLGTAVAGGQKHGLVTAFLAKHYTGVVGAPLTAPVPTATTIDHNSLVAASLMVNTTGHSGAAAGAPVPTLATGGHQALVAASLVRHFGESVGGPVDVPAPTVVAGGGGKTGIVAANMIALRHGDKAWTSMEEPAATVLAEANHLALVRSFLLKYYGTANGQSLADPAHTVTATDRLGLVTVAGQDYQLADIGMRMLEPRELYRAQGFPDSYVIDRAWFGDGETRVLRVLPKHTQVRACGNSVCPPLAAALVAANVPEMAVGRVYAPEVAAA